MAFCFLAWLAQESFFTYLFGVTEAGFYGAVDLRSGEATLFAPRLPAEARQGAACVVLPLTRCLSRTQYEIWMGRIPTTDELAAKCARAALMHAHGASRLALLALRYAVASVRYVDELPAVLASAPVVHLLCGLNTDSGSSTVPAAFPGLEALRCDTSTALHAALCACRAIKSPAELAVLRYACKLSSEAHVAVMRQAKSGMHEYQLESLFMHHCYMWGGARHVGYTCSACPACCIWQPACALTQAPSIHHSLRLRSECCGAALRPRGRAQ